MDTDLFEELYQCYPASTLSEGTLKKNVEHGGKSTSSHYACFCSRNVVYILGSIYILARLNISYPMMFEISNPQTSKFTHCGVLEFSAPEGCILKTLNLKSGAIIRLRNVTLPLGTFVKIQPLSPSFLDISDPRAVLEHSLRRFSAMTVNDCLSILYNNKVFDLRVLEIRPRGNAISVVETDLQVEFSAPEGYEESSKSYGKKSIASSLEMNVDGAPPSGGFSPFSGSSNRLSSKSSGIIPGKPMETPPAINLPPGTLYFGQQKDSQDSISKSNEGEEKKWKPFSGKSQTLK